MHADGSCMSEQKVRDVGAAVRECLRVAGS
jgi:hypothetical protein